MRCHFNVSNRKLKIDMDIIEQGCSYRVHVLSTIFWKIREFY